MKNLALLFLVLFGLQNGFAQTAKRPNIVFIYTDDQRFDALSVVQNEQGLKARFPWFKTSNLDRLAAGGVRFRNAFVVNSLCSPSRSTMLTGKYSHKNNITNNHTEITDTTVTYATLLRKAGYKTGFFGKWHMGNQTGKRPGFDESASFVGQGKYVDCPVEVNGKPTPTIGWIDDVTTGYTLDFIRQNQSKPFVAVLAYKSGHGPFQPAKRNEGLYAGAKLTEPLSEADTVPYKGKVDAYNPNRLPQPQQGGTWTQKNDAKIRGYFEALKGVDENVGRILNTLDSLHLTENTLVIFSSDNGFFLGEHGLGDKRAAYDESMRVPLIVRYPSRIKPGQTNDELALNLDIAPTLVDAAGLTPPKSFQGKSLLPLAEKKITAWRKSFFYEYFFENQFNTPAITAVRTKTAKLVTYPGEPGWTELFDLAKDPLEQKNLFNQPSASTLKKQLQLVFIQQSKAVEYTVPAVADKPPVDANGHYTPPKPRPAL